MACRRRGVTRRFANLTEAWAARQATGEYRRRDGIQVGLTGERDVEMLEPPSGGEQKRRRLIAAALRERDLGTQQIDPCEHEIVGGSGLRHGEESGRRLERPGVELRLCSFQGALRAAGRILRQRGRALEERGHRCDAATSLGPLRRTLEFHGDVLVGAGRRLRTVPCPAIGIDVSVDRLGQRPMCLLAVRQGCRPVDRRAHQRMTKSHQGAEPDQSRSLRRYGRFRSKSETVRGTPQQAQVPEWLRRRGEQQPL